MKLLVQIAKGYYRAKFRALGSVSPRIAADAAFQLFCTPYSGKPKREMPPVFQQGTSRSFTFNNLEINGFEWLPAQLETRGTVLICHGFDSFSYRFDAYVTLLLQQGFRVLAFDAPGHGISGGKTLNIVEYKQIILYIIAQYGPVYSILSHSIGALAVALAAEELQQPNVKLTLIAPASELSRAVKQFTHIFPLAPASYQAFVNRLETAGSHPIHWFSVNRVVQSLTNPVLWLHDTEDRICPFADTDDTRLKKLSHVRFIETTGLGHSQIYREESIQKQIIDFTIY
ncbi:Lysophospholipase, alpha-beta hydrolase superfamily [Filimonas lacunae]|uniref:Lysophospholipase, alpha-beta hydrolase superfamily n=1 Tax=Filimonas lacunae TaxID=477680 RepID=A0A173MDS2_9BACT|nr:alpha/beta fold hydrolase [Filimonas lacunae]BAV05742.1 hydrolase [Filimonas lacunae]SIT28741.1 Lysophospholipase, alpha-beta hydrolase superfamily [Filimonas lacunae]